MGYIEQAFNHPASHFVPFSFLFEVEKVVLYSLL
jgi:hypothetical protein